MIVVRREAAIGVAGNCFWRLQRDPASVPVLCRIGRVLERMFLKEHLKHAAEVLLDILQI
jgi:hypothetical protein